MSRAAWLVLALAGCSSAHDDATTTRAAAQAAPTATFACGDKTCTSGVEACIDSGCVGSSTYACTDIEAWKKANHGQDISSCNAFGKTGGTLGNGDTADTPTACTDEDGGVQLDFDTCSQGCYGCPPARLERAVG